MNEGSITDGQWTPDIKFDLKKEYVLAVGGRPIDLAAGVGGILNHYSLMQWEGLFPCLPELNGVDDLEEMELEAFKVSFEID